MRRLKLIYSGLLLLLSIFTFDILTADPSGGELASFNLTYENEVVAGLPFAILVTDAVDENGLPADGWVEIELIGGGEDSPDGYVSILNNVYVENGSGLSDQYIFKTGNVIIRASSTPFYNDIYFSVEPASLRRLELIINETQYTDYPMIGPAKIKAYDLFGNLKIDFDASDQPVTILADNGIFEPTLFDQPTDFKNGSLNLAGHNVVYSGTGGLVRLAASAPNISDSWVDIYFNKIAFRLDDPLPDTIYLGGVEIFHITAFNEGNDTPYQGVNFESYFASCSNICSNQRDIPAIMPNDVFSFWETPNSDSLTAFTSDTLILSLESRYTYMGDTIINNHALVHPVTVVRPEIIDYFPGSLTLDTLRIPSTIEETSIQFYLNNAINYSNPTLILALSVDIDNGEYDRWYSPRQTSLYNNGIFLTTFFDLEIVDYSSYSAFMPGWHRMKIDGKIIDGENQVPIMALVGIDSVYLAYPDQINYIDQSLVPIQLYDGLFENVEFDLNVDGFFDIEINTIQSRLELLYNDDPVLIGYLANNDSLWPGTNHLTTSDIFIPNELVGFELSPRLILVGLESGESRIDTLLFGSDILEVLPSVVSNAEIKILSCRAVGHNIPFLNYNQPFSIIAELENLSEYQIDSITLQIQSEDGTIVYAEQNNLSLDSPDTLAVEFQLIAPMESLASLVYRATTFAPQTIILPSDDNMAAVTVQKPADIELLLDIDGLNDGYIDYDQQFEITAQMVNRGEASVGGGELRLTTSGYNFGVADPTKVALEVDSSTVWSLISPSENLATELIVIISDMPVDQNNNLPARIIVDSIGVPVYVESPGQEVFIGSAENSETPLIIPGQKSEMFRLNLSNNSADSVSIITLKSIDVQLMDRNGNLVMPDDILKIGGSGFYTIDESLLTSGIIMNQKLKLNFDNFNIYPGTEEMIRFIAEFLESLKVKEFGLKVISDDISAAYLNGPRAGQSVNLSSEFGGDFNLGGNFVITESSLEKSLMVNNNPFNPEAGAVDIAYYLNRESDVALNIYTLLGEEVYRQAYPAGSNGGMSGSNTIHWDGRNDEGRLVLNGVYVISIAPAGGKAERLKVAVLK